MTDPASLPQHPRSQQSTRSPDERPGAMARRFNACRDTSADRKVPACRVRVGFLQRLVAENPPLRGPNLLRSEYAKSLPGQSNAADSAREASRIRGASWFGLGADRHPERHHIESVSSTSERRSDPGCCAMHTQGESLFSPASGERDRRPHSRRPANLTARAVTALFDALARQTSAASETVAPALSVRRCALHR